MSICNCITQKKEKIKQFDLLHTIRQLKCKLVIEAKTFTILIYYKLGINRFKLKTIFQRSTNKFKSQYKNKCKKKKINCMHEMVAISVRLYNVNLILVVACALFCYNLRIIF